MKVLNAKPLIDGVSKNLDMLSRLEGEILSIQKATESLINLESSFKGNAGEAFRLFYQECHIPFLKFFITFKENLTETLHQYLHALAAFDSDETAVIREDFLDGEIEHKLNEIKKITATITDDTNMILKKVADIVQLPSIDDAAFQSSVQQAMKMKNDTVEGLHRFDHSQKQSMSSIENDLTIMDQWISDIEGMIKEGQVNTRFPAQAWVEYSSISPLRKELEVRNNKINDPTQKDTSKKNGDVSGTLPFLYAAKDQVGQAKRANTSITGAISSFRMYMAGRKNGLSVTKVYNPKTKTYTYRIQASGKALSALGVEPDSKAYKELMSLVPKGSSKLKGKHYQIAESNKVTLKYATKKPGHSGWSKVGEQALKKHPSLAYWNDQATTFEKAKTVGKAALKGAGKSFKDTVDVKGIAKSGSFLKGATKSLGPISAGLSYYSNHQQAAEDGLTGKTAHTRAAFDTGIDLAIGGAVQAGLTAAGTMFIPIPGIGTAIGFAAGIALNSALNSKDKKGKSIMDNIKGWFH
ncbi:ribonuclease YeeF family protein [Bacillus weihaiensis]|uniref:ribonuclease YeeF family protein n=1 Tax=Bacillus weihaiensis TaxID=1547283 RepID=UPI002352D34F|nr:LXG domain-containing protein [Bacillus weihaiensis]